MPPSLRSISAVTKSSYSCGSPMAASRSGFAFSTSTELEPACVPSTLPERSASEAMPESERTTRICSLARYGMEKVICSMRSGVIVRPDQMQSMFLPESSSSLESHEIGWRTSSTPRRSVTSLARSMSKPTYSPFSSTKPIGGYSSSKPITKVPFALTSARPVSSASAAAKQRVRTAASRAASIFFIRGCSFPNDRRRFAGFLL